MNVLDYLTQKQNIHTTPKHPLAQHASSFKYNYCFGLSVLVYGYKDQLPATLTCFSSILNEIHLDIELQKKLSVQVKNNFDLKINDTFKELTEKNEQYCFIADLHRLSFFGLISPTYCKDIIEGYCQVFNFSENETRFLKEFTDLGFQTTKELSKETLSYYDTKLDKAVELYQNFKLAGYDISTIILEYIYPSFSLTNRLEDCVFDDGSIQCFESNLRIDGEILLSNCSTLVFANANVKINGSILAENGKIIIKNSHIYLENCEKEHFITVQNSPSIRIENSTIDCNHKAAFLNQNSGHLKIQKTKIQNTGKDYGIHFSGNSADISTSTFENCDSGALFNFAKKELFIASSTFTNCHNVHGGAIHSRSMANTTIYNCKFRDCHAKYIGGAVYFANLKYGQSVMNCTFEHCTPIDDILFNAYDNDCYERPKKTQ